MAFWSVSTDGATNEVQKSKTINKRLFGVELVVNQFIKGLGFFFNLENSQYTKKVLNTCNKTIPIRGGSNMSDLYYMDLVDYQVRAL
jgi:hypothetical protein